MYHPVLPPNQQYDSKYEPDKGLWNLFMKTFCEKIVTKNCYYWYLMWNHT